MNLRNIWTEVFKKPLGRLLLFLLAVGIFLFIFVSRRGTQPLPINADVPKQAPVTHSTGYSFEQEIPPLPRSQPEPKTRRPDSHREEERLIAPKTPPPIAQTIFATKEQARSDFYLPYGRLLRCELVNTIDSTNLETPIIGLLTQDIWHNGRRILPAGMEVHGIAQKTAARERIGSERQWFLVFQDGRELAVSGSVLDNAPDSENSSKWRESDGSAGLRGYLVQADKYAEAKAILAAMLSGGAGAFAKTTHLISPWGGSTQLHNGGFQDAFSAGVQSGAQIYSQRLLQRLDREPFHVRVPAGTPFYLYLNQTVDLSQAAVGRSGSQSSTSSTRSQP